MSENYITWLEDCAKYFENRPTHGEDKAHWANVFNAENARKAAAALVAAEKQIAELREALKPFRDAADRADMKAAESARLGMGTLTDNASTGLGIKFGHLRNARRVYESKEGTRP